MRVDVSTAARAPSTRLSRLARLQSERQLRAAGASRMPCPGRAYLARAATPKNSFTSRSELAGLSEACTELNCLLSP